MKGLTYAALGLIATTIAIPASAQTRYLMREKIVGMPKTASTTTPPASGITCGANMPKTWTVTGGKTPVVVKLTASTSVAEAKGKCEASGLGYAGMCIWRQSDGFTAYTKDAVAQSFPSDTEGLNLMNCTAA